MTSTMRRQISFVIVTAVLLAGPMAFAQRLRFQDQLKQETSGR